MKNKLGGLFLAAPLLAFALALPARAADPASTVCKDGTTSTATGRGACSGHGGVQKAAKTPPAASASDAATSSSAASGATTCKDGTTSASSGRGACSGHGGVQKASKSKPAADAAEAPTPGASTPGGSTPGGSSTAAPSTAAKSSVASKSAPHRKGRQYGSDRRDCQVQGWHLFEVAAPHRHLLAPWRRRRMVEGSVGSSIDRVWADGRRRWSPSIRQFAARRDFPRHC